MKYKLCIFCKQNKVKTKYAKFCSHSCYAQSLVGHKQSKKTIEKRIRSLTGKKRTAEQKLKLSIAMTGIKKTVKHDKQFKKGDIPWIKGKKHTKEAKVRIGEASLGNTYRRGKEMSLESRKKMSCHGRKNPITIDEWDGFSSDLDKLERHKFRNEIQKLVLERDDYTCQMCEKRGGYLQVDHIQSWADYVELRFDINNCRTLCMDCHYFITFGKNKPEGVIWGHNFKNAEIRG